jgi:hypothetical protein
MPALTRKNAPNYADRVNLIKKIKLDEAAALRPLSLKPMEGSRTRCGSTVLEPPYAAGLCRPRNGHRAGIFESRVHKKFPCRKQDSLSDG